MAFGSQGRGGRKIRLVAVHTAEGARTAVALRNFFDGNTNASCHTIISAGNTLDIVPRALAAWTLRSGNNISVNAELCAFAKWTRAQWLSATAVDGCENPRAILSRTAAWIRRECVASNVPMVKLTAADVAAGKSGVIGHIDWTNGMKDGSHWDPGPGFPWDVVMAEVRQGAPAAAAAREDSAEVITDADLDRIAQAVATKVQLRNPNVPKVNGQFVTEPWWITDSYLEYRVCARVEGMITSAFAAHNEAAAQGEQVTRDQIKAAMASELAEVNQELTALAAQLAEHDANTDVVTPPVAPSAAK